ncbi:MAG: phosphate transport system substrate-binding [Geobacteraceae bacterium]|nr:MAG: phosphate transport system substrate-binding [Geobacteraceae bacterium]
MVISGRYRLWLIAGAMLLVQMTAPGMAGQVPAATPLVFAGSGTNLPIVRILAEEFQKRHPEIHIEVPASIGSTSGIRAAADGAIALGLISRPLKENEKGLGLEVATYARTPLIIGVHQTVAEDNISYAEILDIYRGKKNRWKDGRDIVVLTRESGDSTIEVMEKGVPGFKEVYDESQKAKRWTPLLKDLEMNQTLAKTPHAIGFSDLGALTVERHKIKPLKVNGVAPTLKNLQNGIYPLAKPLMFVFHREKLPATAKEFLAFVHSKEGAKIMKANGYLPGK